MEHSDSTEICITGTSSSSLLAWVHSGTPTSSSSPSGPCPPRPGGGVRTLEALEVSISRRLSGDASQDNAGGEAISPAAPNCLELDWREFEIQGTSLCVSVTTDTYPASEGATEEQMLSPPWLHSSSLTDMCHSRNMHFLFFRVEDVPVSSASRFTK